MKNYISLENIYSAGRLDYDSEGLLVITGDGSLINRLTDPVHHLVKTYLALLEGEYQVEPLKRLEQGIELKGYRTQPCQVMAVEPPSLPERRKALTPHGPTFWVRLQLSEGKKREIRHMTAAVGYPCLRLIRVAIGPIGMGNLQPGQWRELSKSEIELLKKRR